MNSCFLMLALENMNNFREFMFPDLFPSKNAKRMRSSGEAYAYRSSSVTFSRSSGEATLVGVRKQNVGRPPAKAPFTEVAAPHPDSKRPQRRLPNNQKKQRTQGPPRNEADPGFFNYHTL
jgi:hypothetical protein